MRTAVVRVNVDPSGLLTAAQLDHGMSMLLELADQAGAQVGEAGGGRREVQLLVAGGDTAAVKQIAVGMCANAFGTAPHVGVVTYVSRGTDDDAHGVLAGFGLTGQITRVPGDEGFDIVHVTLNEADLERIPESRIHTALEASLNCEVHIHTA